jgi:hypothetical protein
LQRALGRWRDRNEQFAEAKPTGVESIDDVAMLRLFAPARESHFKRVA